MEPTAPRPHPDYDFILNPATQTPKRLLNVGQSPLARAVVVCGGLMVLLILFVVIKGALSGGGSKLASMISVAQDQQELIHLAGAANAQAGVTTSTLNSTATILASISSAQQQLLAYLKDNQQKFTSLQINQKVSATVDAQLSAAATSGTYDQTYREVMQTALSSYQQSLKQSYAQIQGPRGRALLTADYNGAKLLILQLSGS